jgi:hypothetical protein
MRSGARHATAEPHDEPPDDAYLDPLQASQWLQRRFNIRRGVRRLAELRAEGTGPEYFRDGNAVRYQPRHLKVYALRCLGTAYVSTAQEAEDFRRRNVLAVEVRATEG